MSGIAQRKGQTIKIINPQRKEIPSQLNEFSMENQSSLYQSVTEENQNDYLEILCLNCQNYIMHNLIEEHSKQCISIQQEVLENEILSDQLQSTNFKIQKLSILLQNNINFKLKKQKLMQQIDKICVLLAMCEQLQVTIDIEKIKEIQKKLDQLVQQRKNDIHFSSLAEKLKNLLKEKQDLLLNEQLSEEDQIQQLQSILQKQQNQLNCLGQEVAV